MMSRLRAGTQKPSTLRVRKIVSGESDTTEVVLPRVNVRAPHLKYWEEGRIHSIDLTKEEFSSLSWEEKELVLRTLFSKMNA